MRRFQRALRALARTLRRVGHFGRARLCPVCGSSVRRFVAQGVDGRPDAKCPVCRSLERDRLTWLVLDSRVDLRRVFDRGGSMLHVAPEQALESRFRAARGLDYVSGDLAAKDVTVRFDVQALPFADETFDAVYCSHVLEHVDDDRRAMRELQRVLKPDGWAVLLVPICAKRTDEDPSCTDPDERRRRFGQADHVRAYGPDYLDRLREAGFDVEPITATELLSADDCERMRVPPTETVYVCRK